MSRSHRRMCRKPASFLIRQSLDAMVRKRAFSKPRALGQVCFARLRNACTVGHDIFQESQLRELNNGPMRVQEGWRVALRAARRLSEHRSPHVGPLWGDCGPTARRPGRYARVFPLRHPYPLRCPAPSLAAPPLCRKSKQKLWPERKQRGIMLHLFVFLGGEAFFSCAVQGSNLRCVCGGCSAALAHERPDVWSTGRFGYVSGKQMLRLT